MQLELTVLPEQQGVTLGLFLRRQGLSAALIKSIKYTAGGLCVNGKQAKTNQFLQLGDKVAVRLPAEGKAGLEPEDIPLECLYEDAHLLVVNKPAGMVMHPTRTHKSGTLGNAFCGLMLRRGSQRAFRAVGRLDAGTSGVVLCAMNPFAASLLAASMCKGYLALATGRLPLGKGEIRQPIGTAPQSIIQKQVRPDGRPSETGYEVVAASEMASLVLVWPRTGRTHQIRVHFSWLGHPLVGDTLYGGDNTLFSHHALHCGAVQVTLPSAGEKMLTVAPPQDFRKVAVQAGLAVCWEQQLEKLAAETCGNGAKPV